MKNDRTRTDPAKRPALGRGLSALLPGGPVPGAQPARGLLTVPVDEVSGERDQPRRHFNPKALEELAASIRAKGVLQPILVRKLPEGGYRIIAGERRWRAARQAGLTDVPVIVKEISEVDVFELALIENIQREDLSPIEEAEAYQRLLTEHGLTQEDLASRVGKERSTIANALRLLRLPDELRDSVATGDLSVGHAKVLLGLDDPARMITVGGQVLEKGWSVRETERHVQRMKQPGERRPRSTTPSELEGLAQKLALALRHPVDVRMRTKDAGELVVSFGTPALGQQLVRTLLAAMEALSQNPVPRESDAPRSAGPGEAATEGSGKVVAHAEAGVADVASEDAA